jgi:acetyltransferase-like isoleucine patch superfamily enzyme
MIGLRACSKCGGKKSSDEFPSNPRGKGNWCKACRAAYQREWRAKNPERANAATRRWKQNNPDKVRARHLRVTYGITEEFVELMVEKQQGLCGVCNLPLRDDKAVDHCHKTGVVRGILHKQCNAGLGSLGDSYVTLQRAAAYLYRHQPGNRVHPLTVIGDPPEHRDAIWKHYQSEKGKQFLHPVIEATAVVGAYCTIDAGLEEPTRVGAHSLLMKHCHIGHDAQIGERCELGAGTVICGHVVIEDDVQIGGNTWVKPKVRIGKGARLGGGSVVVKDVPAGEVWAGNPAKPLRKGREFLSRQGRVIPIPPLV